MLIIKKTEIGVLATNQGHKNTDKMQLVNEINETKKLVNQNKAIYKKNPE